MTPNDILRRVRYILDARDNKIAAIFAKADHEVSTDQVNAWLKKDDDPEFVALTDEQLRLFLDGLIIDQRGPKDGPKVKYIQPMNNNLILMKLKIAFNLKSEDVMAMMNLANFKISPHEITALFRKKDHKNYRVCKNQILRKFLKGLQLKYRGRKPAKKPLDENTPVAKANNPATKKSPAAKNKAQPAANQIWQQSLDKVKKPD